MQVVMLSQHFYYHFREPVLQPWLRGAGSGRAIVPQCQPRVTLGTGPVVRAMQLVLLLARAHDFSPAGAARCPH